MSRIRKPLLGAPLNLAHRLCPLNNDINGGFVLALNEDSGTPRALLGPKPDTGFSERLATFTGPPKWNPYPGATGGRSQFGGPTLSHLNTTDITSFGANTDFILLDVATFVFATRKRDTTLRNAGIFACNTATASQRCEFQFRSDGTTFFAFGGVTGGTSLLATGTVTHGDDVWACSVGPRGMDIYQNGSLLASQTGHATRTGNVADFRMGNAPSSSGGGDIVDYGFLYIYNRQLNPEEIRAISVSPFSFYEGDEDEPRGPITETQTIGGTLTSAGTTIKSVTKSYSGAMAPAAALAASATRTRLYFDSGTTSPIAPAYDAGWTTTSKAVRMKMNYSKGSSPLTSGSRISWANAAGSKGLDRQYASFPLDGAQTISGSVKMQLLVQEFASNDNADQVIITAKVYSRDGSTLRGTLLSLGSYGPTTEFLNTGKRNKIVVDGDIVTPVSASNEDRIVIEIGYSSSGGGNSPEGQALWGEVGPDATEGDETETSSEVGWVEFAGTVVFKAESTQTVSPTGGVSPTGNIIKQVGKIL